MSRMLCVWFPLWPVQRLRRAGSVRARSGPGDAPCALFEEARQGLRLRECCPRAAELGLRPGMPVAEARALAGSDAVQLVPADPAADRLALGDLAELCRQFAPRVGLEEAERPESLLLDVTGCGAYFGDDFALVDCVRQALTPLGLEVRLSVANTIGAAWGVAHFGSTEVVPPEVSSAAVLAPLPIAALRIDAEAVATLRELGIVRIGQLTNLPRSELPARFGPQILTRLDQALGRQVEILAPQHPPAAVEVVRTFDEPLSGRGAVEIVLKSLLSELVAPLESRGQGIVRLCCRLVADPDSVPRDTACVELPVSLFRPTVSVRHLHELFRLRLERLALPGPISSFELKVQETAPLPPRQTVWCQTDERAEREQDLGALLDRLTSRLSPAAVLRARSLGEAQPEFRFEYEPWISPDASNDRDNVSLPRKPPARRSLNEDQVAESPTVRPCRMIVPACIAVTSFVPHGPPVRFWWKNGEHIVVRCWGPERLETGWWRGTSAARDYYRVETAAGLHAWLFRQLDNGKWHLHGWFG